MKFNLIGAFMLAFVCAGCGNKGALYIPQRPVVAPAKKPPAAQPAPVSTDDSKAPAAGAKP
ncbi:MAG: lipoprotein [Candidatus Methylophosphatis roskildensis]